MEQHSNRNVKRQMRASPERDQATASTRIARKHPNFGAQLAQYLRIHEAGPSRSAYDRDGLHFCRWYTKAVERVPASAFRRKQTGTLSIVARHLLAVQHIAQGQALRRRRSRTDDVGFYRG